MLWVRSDRSVDVLELRTSTRRYLVSSMVGEVELLRTGNDRRDSSWERSSRHLDEHEREYRLDRVYHITFFGFGFETDPDPDISVYNILAPHWYLSAMAMARHTPLARPFLLSLLPPHTSHRHDAGCGGDGSGCVGSAVNVAAGHYSNCQRTPAPRPLP